jgi:hypothetical protein
MVQAVLKQLTYAEAILVRVHGDFPSGGDSGTRLNTAYTEARGEIIRYRTLAIKTTADFNADPEPQEIVEDMPALASDSSDDDADDGGGGNAVLVQEPAIEDEVQGDLNHVWIAAVRESRHTKTTLYAPDDDDRTPSHNAIRSAAKQWTKRFLTHGNVRDLPPSVKGAKRKLCLPQLERVHAKILQGWTDKCGRNHAYADLDDLERRDRRAFSEDALRPEAERMLANKQPYHEIKEQMKIKHNRYMWEHLTAVYPYLRRIKHRVRRARKDRDQVMVSSHACDLHLVF